MNTSKFMRTILIITLLLVGCAPASIPTATLAPTATLHPTAAVLAILLPPTA